MSHDPQPPDSTLGADVPGATLPPALERGAYLLVFEEASTRMVPLSAGDHLIGRAETCAVRLEDQRVSRHHARLTLKDGRAHLHDLGSQNGTRVNDELLKTPYLLSSGDVVTIGSAALVFHMARGALASSGLLDAASFRARADVELERARRYGRPLSAVLVQLDQEPEAAALQAQLAPLLRRADLATLAKAQLSVLCPETPREEAEPLVAEWVEALGARAGVAVFPDDALDAETLFAGARAAALSAAPAAVALAATTVRELHFGAVRVWVADASMSRLYELVERLAQSPLTVLVHGETGAGKELVATALHHQSPRRSARFVAVNCAAFTESLLESELFGHEKGAFTGAVSAKPGVFEQAEGGTLFLDEVGEMSAALQAKLLRVLETKRLTRVGDTHEREVDVRVVAATHRDLSAEVKAGRFREDLFFRLSGATVWVPPLRDRPRELPLLARRFLDQACQESGRSALVLTPGALVRLAAHRWPGNVRELKNVMAYLAATVSEGAVEAWQVSARLDAPTAAPPSTPAAPSSTPLARAFRPLADEVRELEERRMLEALDACEWNQTRAAAAIGMPLRTFVTRFKQFDLGARRGSVRGVS